MVMKISVQKAAAKRINEIYTYGETHFGKQAAEALHERIMESLCMLEKQPYAGMIEPLLRKRRYSYRSLVIHEHFKIIYHIAEKCQTIYIADLWDTRREPRILSNSLK